MIDVSILALDYDGTLATKGTVFPETISALQALVSSGRSLILATGRQLPELLDIFPEASLFEWIIAENGAVIHESATGDSNLMGDPPPREFVRLLNQNGVEPLAMGQVIVSTKSQHAGELTAAIDWMGLSHQVILNKDSAMVLPRGVNKGSSLLSLLKRLGMSKRHVLSVGDGENDVDLFRASGFSVAVANAVPELKELANWVTLAPAGSGVQTLSERLIACQ